MADRTGLAGNRSLALIVTVLALVAILAWWLLGPEISLESEQAVSETADSASDPEPSETASEVEVPEAPESEAEASAQIPDDPEPPSIDVVRVDGDGNSIVAGRAEPGSTVIVLLDGEEVSRTEAGIDGSFAVILEFPLSQTERLVTLIMEMEGREPLESESVVIIAPSLAVSPADPASSATSDPAPEIAEVGDEDSSRPEPVDSAPLADTSELADARTLEETDATLGANLNTEESREAGSDRVSHGQEDDSGIGEVVLSLGDGDASPRPEQDAPQRIGLPLPEGSEPSDTGMPQTELDAPAKIAQGEVPEREPSDDLLPPSGMDGRTEATATSADAETQTAGVVSEIDPAASGDLSSPAPEESKTAASEDSRTLLALNETSALPRLRPLEKANSETALPELEESKPINLDLPVPEVADQIRTGDDLPVIGAAPEVEMAGKAIVDDTGTGPGRDVSLDITLQMPAGIALPGQSDGIQANAGIPAIDGEGSSEAGQLERDVLPPAVMLADNTGIRVLQSGGDGPQDVQTVVIDTISYDEAGEVQLGGRGTGSQFVRIYLDNRPVRTVRIGDDGQWRTPLPNVDSGIFDLRVDELNLEGEVTSRMETPFKREDRDVLAELHDSDSDGRPRIRVITVQRGNTLWGIARDRYGEGILYVRVFEANRARIRDPDLIYPGQIFAIPE